MLEAILEFFTGKKAREAEQRLIALQAQYDALAIEHSTFKATVSTKIRAAEAAARKDSNRLGVVTRRAAVQEQISPLLPSFPYDPQNVQWLGGTVDFIVWDGRVRDTDEISVVFVDIKTGRAELNARQIQVKQAVDAGRVRFEVFRPDDNS